MTTLALVALGALFDGPGTAARDAARPDVAAVTGVPLATVSGRGEAVDAGGGIAGPALAGAGIGLVGATGLLLDTTGPAVALTTTAAGLALAALHAATAPALRSLEPPAP